MTWEWSHTAEAYHNAHANLCQQSDEWLAECWAEWELESTMDEGDPTAIYRNSFNAAMTAIRTDREAMIEELWQYANEARRCANGGHILYICPYACHSVSVDPPEDDEELPLGSELENLS